MNVNDYVMLVLGKNKDRIPILIVLQTKVRVLLCHSLFVCLSLIIGASVLLVGVFMILYSTNVNLFI